MKGYRIENGFIDFSKTDFNCPSCNKQYTDDEDLYLNRCNKNKKGITRINCSCGIKFYMTYNFMSEAVSFTYLTPNP